MYICMYIYTHTIYIIIEYKNDHQPLSIRLRVPLCFRTGWRCAQRSPPHPPNDKKLRGKDGFLWVSINSIIYTGSNGVSMGLYGVIWVYMDSVYIGIVSRGFKRIRAL